MAVVSMQKLSVAASKRHRKGILEALQSMGAMEIFTDEITDDSLLKMDTVSQRNQFEKNADSFDRVLKLLSSYAPENKKGMAALAGHDEIRRSDYDRVVAQQAALRADASAVLKLEKEILDSRGIILKDTNQITALTPWMNLDVPMNTEETAKTAVLIGTIPDEITEPQLYAAAAKDLPEPAGVTCELISSSSEQSCVVVLALKKDARKVEDNLRSKGFSRPSQMISSVPKDEIAALEADIEARNKKIEELGKQIASYARSRQDMKIAADYYRARADKYKVLGTLPQSGHAFFLEGWVTKDSADDVIRLLTEKFDACVEKEETREDELEPTVLKNNRFSESVEGVLASYGLPTKGHVDPTFIMSFFYVFFFGMMLSDAGYGILMALACGFILLKHKNLEPGLGRMLKLFFWCGLSTTFWGFMYGGFFGNAIDIIAQTFFGYTGDTILKPIWFEPLKQPMRLLIWCMLFGVIHLFMGLGIKGYEALKNHDVVGFISDIVAWYLFLIGLIFMLLPSGLFASISGMTFNFPSWIGPFAKYTTLAGLVIILVMSGRSNKNWALRIALGAYDIYGVTGWLSDVLSYSRLLALGLATGVIGSVINLMASMVAKGKGVIGAIIFIIIFVFGHLLNIGINALGAYVHTNRLQYVEFFGKFYDAGGRAFRPFKTTNHYVDIKEERSL